MTEEPPENIQAGEDHVTPNYSESHVPELGAVSTPEITVKTEGLLLPKESAVHEQQLDLPVHDPDATICLTESLRAQINDLFTQVTQLNAKLVQSYDQRANLEDSLHVAQSTIQSSAARITSLEAERTEHLAALNTGLLVERSQVTAELTRLMERATEEAGKRGQAEIAKQDIEKDLDDLSATLFSQANTMVAEARYARAMSERKVEDAEAALKGAEEAVSSMQLQMQQMRSQMETAKTDPFASEATLSKAKRVEFGENEKPATLRRFRTSHLPYREYESFITHLRNMRPASALPPTLASLVSTPFLSRLANEDSEPTIRLDIAPALNWISRRSVNSAMQAGQLMIEPMSISHVFQEPPFLTANSNEISCALCGCVIVSAHTKSRSQRPPLYPKSQSRPSSGSGSWFKNTIQAYAGQITASPVSSAPGNANHHLQQIFIFRLSPTANNSAPSVTSVIASVNLPFPSTGTQNEALSPTSASSASTKTGLSNGTKTVPSTVYPLCSKWCLPRLRTTSTLWAFVRTAVVDKVWEEPLLIASALPSPTIPPTDNPVLENGTPPPIPPRKRGLWGMASALSERAASWAEDKSKDKPLNVPSAEKDLRKSPMIANLPPPLPPRNSGRDESRSALPIPLVSTTASDGQVPNLSHNRSSIGSVIFAAGPDAVDEAVLETCPAGSRSSPNEQDFSPAEPFDAESASVETASVLPVTVEISDGNANTTAESVLESSAALLNSLSGGSEISLSNTRQLQSGQDQPKMDTGENLEGATADLTLPRVDESAPNEKLLMDPPAVPPPLPRRAERRNGADGQKGSINASEGQPTSENDELAVVPAVVPMEDDIKPIDQMTASDISDRATRDLIQKTSQARADLPSKVEHFPPPPVRNAARSTKTSSQPSTEMNGTVRRLPGRKLEDVDEPSADDDTFAGDETWEHRTWRELLKLREDMYFARVGLDRS